ncbi:MAG TPA: TadE/TadG family type IV pilus assembly protein [Rhizomicrobium sp.]|nr:TadE/TadG family type IV pilus assembly protein [Rhizomicrobium sp.]
MSIRIKSLAAYWRRFLQSERGNVAIMFAVALIPLMIGAGAGLDFARAMLVRQQMTEALDAAALAVGSTTGLNQTSAQTLAQRYFDANYSVDKGQYGSPSISIPPTGYNGNGSVVITASDTMPTVLMKIAGITSLPVTASSNVVWGQSKLWVALVLDNSGSMSQGDANGTKMAALKSASAQLLTVLQNAARNPGDVQAGIVPFTNVVKVGAGNVAASWLDWSDWDAAPKDSSGVTITDAYVIPKSSLPFSAYGPKDDCPFVTTTTKNNKTTVAEDSPFGFDCQKNPNNNSGNVAANNGKSPIPPSGLICPTANSAAFGNDHLARYYNGCWSSTAVAGSTIQVSSGANATCGGFSNSNCSCNNNVCTTQKWTHVWVPNNHNSWSGCVTDRTQDYDIQNTQPSGNASGITAANPTSCVAASVTPLGYNWATLNSQITAMNPGGSTNQAIGVAHGWQMLTPGDPYATPAVPTNTARYLILLSDGLNTQDRWWGDGSTEGTQQDADIDTRENDTCDAAKHDGVIIYTIFLDIGNAHGSSAPLRNCATDSSKYFDLTSTSTVVSTFNQIAQQITNVRVVK